MKLTNINIMLKFLHHIDTYRPTSLKSNRQNLPIMRLNYGWQLNVKKYSELYATCNHTVLSIGKFHIHVGLMRNIWKCGQLFLKALH